ncbi:MAG: cytoplasmic protein [SAR86 cluster bacterium]|uniref:Cytoplasmic protein n=1 Tax=SAR86 cluster bacterium TaxID=2030880 RepID=A0A2A4X4P4_9GAMM|nr:MAG: cytoplasmic protein [SAR86 cluster bacterium]
MLAIPKGSIHLRDDRINKEWAASIASFSVCKYLVTQDIYQYAAKAQPSIFKGNRKPVESVSWHEAVHFCNQLSHLAGYTSYYLVTEDTAVVECDPTANGYRLLTDAEWEYACKAGDNKPRYGEIENIAWYEDNSGGETHDVGGKFPNKWGIYDMLGNVWEWCWDVYDAETYGPYRIFRGGGWCDAKRGCLATNRRRSHPTFQIEDLGFRVARSI